LTRSSEFRRLVARNGFGTPLGIMTRRDGSPVSRGEAAVLVNGLLAGVGSLYVLTGSVVVTVGGAVLATGLATLSILGRPNGS
jgi:hypothetical protein